MKLTIIILIIFCTLQLVISKPKVDQSFEKFFNK